MVQETSVRKGFVADEDYTKLRNELPAELKPLFVVACLTGMRKGELTPIRWEQVDFEADLITLDRGATKNDDARSVLMLSGDMRDLLLASKRERDAQWPTSPWVFNRVGEATKTFAGHGRKPVNALGCRILTSTICAALPYATCEGLGCLRSYE
jgi:integrase